MNRPELTAEKFVPHPFDEHAQTRLYRTGDLARYLPDGNVEFLGRSDEQVKLRGFRIELNEIATCLLQHPQVQEAVVIVQTAGAGEPRLVAYVTAKGESHERGESHGLRAFLQSKLPAGLNNLPEDQIKAEQLPER